MSALGDVCTLAGAQDGWLLVELRGTPSAHGERYVFLAGSQILKVGEKESSYTFRLRLALLNDDACEFGTSSTLTLTAQEFRSRMYGDLITRQYR